jgi:hypothetical protein
MHGQTHGHDEPADPRRWITKLFPPLTTVNFGDSPKTCSVSVVILAKDEERCIARCLDSVTGRGLDDIVVVDTGSVDNTLRIVDGYRDRGVRLIRLPWSNSFARARNFAIDTIATGWIVFLDADEWMTERSAEQLRICLAELSRIEDVSRLAFAPEIVHVDRDEYSGDVARIFKADSAIRFKGPVHEYPVITGGTDEPVGVVGLDIEFYHDGYDRSVATSKNKRQRNLALLEAARADDPHNPRWWYFTIRDGLPVLDHAQLVDACAVMRSLTNEPTKTGDRRSSSEYHRLALGTACQCFAAMGDWASVHRYCDELPSVDAHYFRTIPELLGGAVTERDLLQAIRLRGNDELVSNSVIDSTGRHLDAIIIALLEKVRGDTAAKQYQELCHPWNDVFFDHSRMRPR